MRRQWYLSERRKIFVGLSLGIAVLIGIAVLDLFGVLDYHTSDRVLINNFRAHRNDFETLASMAIEDDVRGLYSDSVMLNDYKIWPADGSGSFSWRRWYEYDALFKRLGTAAQHMLTKESGVLHVPASHISTEPNDDLEYRISEKGYAFSQTPLSDLDDSLDGMGVDDLGITYRRIDEHWYLYHDGGIGKPE